MTELTGQRLPNELAELADGRPLRLLFVRHAETEHNVNHMIQGWSDSPITDLGREQIATIAAALRDEHIDVAFSSDLERVVTTATGIVGARDESLELQLRPALREWNFGGHEELPAHEVFGKLFHQHGLEVDRELTALRTLASRMSFPDIYDGIAQLDESGGSELAADLVVRADEALADIIATAARLEPAEGEDQVTALVISHGGFITTLLRQLVPEETPTLPLANCSVSTVLLRDGEWVLHAVNVLPGEYSAD